MVEQLRQVDGIAAVSSLRSAQSIADVRPPETMMSKKLQTGSTDRGIVVSLLGIDPLSYPEVSGLSFIEGNPDPAYAALASGERTMIVNGPFESTTGVKIGDTVPLITPEGRQDYRAVAIAGDYLNTKLVTAYVSQARMAADFGVTQDVFVQLNLAPGADRAQI